MSDSREGQVSDERVAELAEGFEHNARLIHADDDPAAAEYWRSLMDSAAALRELLERRARDNENTVAAPAALDLTRGEEVSEARDPEDSKRVQWPEEWLTRNAARLRAPTAADTSSQEGRTPYERLSDADRETVDWLMSDEADTSAQEGREGLTERMERVAEVDAAFFSDVYNLGYYDALAASRPREDGALTEDQVLTLARMRRYLKVYDDAREPRPLLSWEDVRDLLLIIDRLAASRPREGGALTMADRKRVQFLRECMMAGMDHGYVSTHLLIEAVSIIDRIDRLAARPVPAAPGEQLTEKEAADVLNELNLLRKHDRGLRQQIQHLTMEVERERKITEGWAKLARKQEGEIYDLMNRPPSPERTPPVGETPPAPVPDWLLDVADAEDAAGSVSVGGLAADAGLYVAPVPMGLGQEHAEAVRRLAKVAELKWPLTYGDEIRLCREVARAIETREPTPEWVRKWDQLKIRLATALYDAPAGLSAATRAAEAALDAHVGVRREAPHG